jgi:hypothetical protein
MKSTFPTLTIWCAILAMGFAGCSGKPDANAELEKAAKVLEQADSGQPTPAPTQPAQPVAVAPASAQQSPSQQMSQAMTLYKNGEYENAVTRLQTLRDRATLSPQQNMALQDAMAAVMTDIYSRAANGDARAQLAVKQYEASKTSQRR